MAAIRQTRISLNAEKGPNEAFKKTGTSVLPRSKKLLWGTALGVLLTSVVGLNHFYFDKTHSAPGISTIAPVADVMIAVQQRQAAHNKLNLQM